MSVKRLRMLEQHLAVKTLTAESNVRLQHTAAGADTPRPFHLAFPVHDLEEARKFYRNTLGCSEGRSSSRWIDFNLHANQITCQLAGKDYKPKLYKNSVDEDEVPFPHFGIALTVDQFHSLAKRLEEAKTKFIIPPHRRFDGMPGEQWTMFFKDPSGNCLEFKAMVHQQNLFSSYYVDE